MALEQLGFGELALIEGETVEATLDLKKKTKNSKEAKATAKENEVLVLTDRRVLHLRAGAKNRETVFVSLEDIFAFEVTAERPTGYAGYIWGALSVLVGIGIWRIWNVDVLDVAAGLIVGAMGVYLVIDQIFAPSTLRATIRAGTSQLHIAVDGDTTEKVYAFANTLFIAKGEWLHPTPPPAPAPSIIFAPR